MKSIPAILVALSFLTPAARAQGSKVIPVSLTSVEGNSSSVYHFGYIYNKSQQIWRNSAVTKSIALINGLKYRRDTRGKSAYTGRTYKSATFSMGTTTVTPEGMSTTFASNVTSALTAVLNNKAYSLPAQPIPTTSPAPFNIPLAWTQPYIYDTKKGHLILQIDLPGSPAKSIYFADAERTAKGGTGTVAAFGTGGAFSRAETYKLSATAAGFAPGGALDVRCGAFTKAYAGALVLGLSNAKWSGLTLPFNLTAVGAPKNSLYVSMDFSIPFATTRSGTANNSRFTTPIPVGAAYAGVSFYAQAWYADAGANTAGIVATNALSLTTSKTQAGATQTVGNYKQTAASGNYLFGSSYLGGPVIQFLGVIP